MAPFSSENQFRFLLSCIKHSNAGKVDFASVAKECGIVSRGAASKRYQRMLGLHGSSLDGKNGQGNAPTVHGMSTSMSLSMSKNVGAVVAKPKKVVNGSLGASQIGGGMRGEMEMGMRSGMYATGDGMASPPKRGRGRPPLDKTIRPGYNIQSSPSHSQLSMPQTPPPPSHPLPLNPPSSPAQAPSPTNPTAPKHKTKPKSTLPPQKPPTSFPGNAPTSRSSNQSLLPSNKRVFALYSDDNQDDEEVFAPKPAQPDGGCGGSIAREANMSQAHRSQGGNAIEVDDEVVFLPPPQTLSQPQTQTRPFLSPQATSPLPKPHAFLPSPSPLRIQLSPSLLSAAHSTPHTATALTQPPKQGALSTPIIQAKIPPPTTAATSQSARRRGMTRLATPLTTDSAAALLRYYPQASTGTVEKPCLVGEEGDGNL